jgi:hypothetical protein
MTPALREEVARLRNRIAKATVADAMVRHDIGTVVKKVRGNRAKYGARALAQLERAFDFDENTLRRFEAVAELWTASGLAKLLARKNSKGLPVSWSHLELLAEVASDGKRDKLIEKTLAESLTVRQLRLLVHPPQAATNEAMEGQASGVIRIRQVTNHVVEVTRDVERLDELLADESGGTPEYRGAVESAAKAYAELRTACDAAISKLEGKLKNVLSRLALTDHAWFGETDRDLGVIGMGEFDMSGVVGLVRPS